MKCEISIKIPHVWKFVDFKNSARIHCISFQTDNLNTFFWLWFFRFMCKHRMVCNTVSETCVNCYSEYSCFFIPISVACILWVDLSKLLIFLFFFFFCRSTYPCPSWRWKMPSYIQFSIYLWCRCQEGKITISIFID